MNNNQQEIQQKSEPNQEYQQFDSNNNLNTEARRRYPKDTKERKAEWEAIELHRQDLKQQLIQSEDEIRNYRQKELLTELDRKILGKLQEKQNILLQKQKDAEYMQLDREDFRNQEQQNKQDKKVFGNIMGQYYNQQLTIQQQRELEEKNQKKNWENKLLEYNRDRLESEQKRKRDHKEFMIQERQADVQRAQQKKQFEQELNRQAENDYKNLMKSNAEREMIKEQNYKNFYKLAANEQNTKHQMHYNNVIQPTLNKNHKIDDIINKNYDQEQRRRAEDELNRVMQRQQASENIRDQNVNLINQHRDVKQVDTIQKDEKVQQRLEDLNNYNKYLDFKRKQKMDEKHQYKDYLDQQSKEREMVRQNELRMTKAEKGLNKLDLQAYKAFDGGMYSMVPGWSPQIGQLPPKQNRERLQQQIQQQLRAKQNTQGGHTRQDSSPNSWQHQYQAQLQKEQNLYNSQTPKSNPFQKIGEPLEKFNASAIYGDYKGTSTQLRNIGAGQRPLNYGHNPLTNPMPFNVQNPYIAKEFNRAQSQSSIFQQAGGNISYNNIQQQQ